MFPYILKQNGSVVVMVDGIPHTVGVDHMNYTVLIEAIKAGDEDAVRTNISIPAVIASYSHGKVEVINDILHFSRQPLHNSIAKRILACLHDGFDPNPFARFLENMMQNPDKRSINELYDFLDACDLPITEDGYFLAYKMVGEDYYDLHSHTMDNSIGKRPAMERKEVDPDRHRTCSYGLHFASLEYIKSGFGNSASGHHLMVVKVNPKDVVAIPADYNNSKGRAWTYEVMAEIEWDKTITPNFTKEHSSWDSQGDEDEWEDDDTDVCDACGQNMEDCECEQEIQNKDNSDRMFTKNQIFEILDLIKAGGSLTRIANDYGTSRRTIGRIRDGESYQDWCDEWVNK